MLLLRLFHLDAFASLVSEDRELMDIYLMGTPVRQLFAEISCGDAGLEGVKVDVPADRFDVLVGRIEEFHRERLENKSAVNSFLAKRCGKPFLQYYLSKYPEFIAQLTIHSYFYALTSVDVLNRIYLFGLLPEDLRLTHVSTVRKYAIQTPDDGFLDANVVSFLTVSERDGILSEIRGNFLPRLAAEVEFWRENCSVHDDASEHFDPLQRALSSFAEALANDPTAIALIAEGQAMIAETVTALDSVRESEPPSDDFSRRESEPSGPDSRSIFEDVDQ